MTTRTEMVGQAWQVLLIGLLLAACGGPTPVPPLVATGIIRTCDYGIGAERCGPCYCLETADRGCEIIDPDSVGDLGYAVGQTVQVTGSRDVLCSEMCPCQIQLFEIKVRVATDGGYRFVELTPTPTAMPAPPVALPTTTATLPPPTHLPTATPTTTPPALPNSACDTAEFDRMPDLAERTTFFREPNRLRGVVDTHLDGMAVYNWQGTFFLRGLDLNVEDGRVVDLQGVWDEQDEKVFHVRAYEVLPHAVLTGRLWTDRRCRQVCARWLLFDVEQDGRIYTFGLTTNRDEYRSLWELAGRTVTLAADLYDNRNPWGLYRLKLRYRCRRPLGASPRRTRPV